MGFPKAWLMLRDRPILQYLLERFRWPGPTLLVTSPAREHPPGNGKFTREVIDPMPDEGPVRGLLTAVQNASSDIVIAVTCDMPLIQREHLLWLVEQLESHPTDLGAMIRRRVNDAVVVEPFPCVLRKSARGVLEQRVLSADRSVHALAKLPNFSLLDAPSSWPDLIWLNLNHPDELQRFLNTIENDANQAPSSSADKYPSAPPDSSPRPPPSGSRGS